MSEIDQEFIMIKIMVLAAAVDGRVDDIEKRRISSIVANYDHFPQPPSNFIEKATHVLASLNMEDTALIKEITSGLSRDYCLPTLAFAYEICAADGTFTKEEKKFLRDLKRVLGVSDDHASAMEISIQSRYFPSDPENAIVEMPITGPNALH